jgi:hypothetical protein
MTGRRPTAVLSQPCLLRNNFLRRVVGILSSARLREQQEASAESPWGLMSQENLPRPARNTGRTDHQRDQEKYLPQTRSEQALLLRFKRLMTLPIAERRTPSRANTVLYSRMISSVTSQVNVPCLNQSRSTLALEFCDAIFSNLRPAIPATRTDVSTTPLGRFRFRAGNDCDFR